MFTRLIFWMGSSGDRPSIKWATCSFIVSAALTAVLLLLVVSPAVVGLGFGVLMIAGILAALPAAVGLSVFIAVLFVVRGSPR